MGADRSSLEWRRVVEYFDRLEKASGKIRVEELGRTTGGRPFLAAWIANPETLERLDHYQSIQRRLADPRVTSDLEPLIREGKTVVLVTCSIHSTEVASTHTAVEFAYRLLTADTPRFQQILENTILILAPSLNPDGVDIVTNWYRKTLGTPFEGSNPPELYHKYVGHDNNRDWYIFSQVETRLTVEKLLRAWRPQIVYDVHQQGTRGSRMFVPPWVDPIEPNVDPILAQQMNLIGMGMAADLTAAGKTGVVVNASYDFWSPSRSYSVFHGGMRILSESASARLASPIEVPREQLERNTVGYDAQERSWNHPEPWAGGVWRLRDIVDYQLIAMKSCLYQAAIRRPELLRNYNRVAARASERKRPWGFLIPAAQPDPGAARKLLEVLEFGEVEIEQSEKGDFVVRMQQPASSFAKALLERQSYPDLRAWPGGPPRRPYDATAHTLPLLMGVRVEALEEPVAGALRPVSHPWAAAARESFAGGDTDAWVHINRIWDAGGEVWRNLRTGDFARAANGPGWRRLRRPRVGLHKSHVPSMDEGWTRWLLEQFGFPYTSLPDREIRSGELGRKFDVVIFPDQAAEVIESGHRAGTMPEEFVGGLAELGAEALREFARAGGKLIFFNRSTAYALDRLGLKTRDVVRGLPSQEFYSPGSLLWVKLEAEHPLTLGMPEQIAIWSEHSPAWNASGVARYPESGLLASGWLLGEKHLARRAALVEAPLGSGRVILFGMRPQYRGQSYQTFKLLFNALIYPRE